MSEMQEKQFQRAKEIIRFLAKEPTEDECLIFITEILKQGEPVIPKGKTFRGSLTRQAAILLDLVDGTWRGFRDGS